MVGNKQYFGAIGLLIGMLALTIAIFQGDIKNAIDPPPLHETTLKGLAVEASKSFIKEKFLGQKKATITTNIGSDTHNWVQVSYMGLGILAIIFGAVSWINKEHIRLSGAAVSLGLIVVAWQYVIIAIFIAVIILIVSNLDF